MYVNVNESYKFTWKSKNEIEFAEVELICKYMVDSLVIIFSYSDKWDKYA